MRSSQLAASDPESNLQTQIGITITIYLEMKLTRLTNIISELEVNGVDHLNRTVSCLLSRLDQRIATYNPTTLEAIPAVKIIQMEYCS